MASGGIGLRLVSRFWFSRGNKTSLLVAAEVTRLEFLCKQGRFRASYSENEIRGTPAFETLGLFSIVPSGHQSRGLPAQTIQPRRQQYDLWVMTSPGEGGARTVPRESSRPLVRHCLMGTYVGCYLFNGLLGVGDVGSVFSGFSSMNNSLSVRRGWKGNRNGFGMYSGSFCGSCNVPVTLYSNNLVSGAKTRLIMGPMTHASRNSRASTRASTRPLKSIVPRYARRMAGERISMSSVWMTLLMMVKVALTPLTGLLPRPGVTAF